MVRRWASVYQTINEQLIMQLPQELLSEPDAAQMAAFLVLLQAKVGIDLCCVQQLVGWSFYQ